MKSLFCMYAQNKHKIDRQEKDKQNLKIGQSILR